MTFAFELAPKFFEVVNLAVVGDPESPVLARHWLVAGGADVDDGEPSVPETHVSRCVQALIVRTAMCDQVVHATEDRVIDRLSTEEVDSSDDAAHVVSPLPSSNRWYDRAAAGRCNHERAIATRLIDESFAMEALIGSGSSGKRFAVLSSKKA
jgi:hypothetical protein